MRRLRPLLFLVFVCGFVGHSQSQIQTIQPVPGGGYNFLLWQPNSPAGTLGGVDTAVSIVPTSGYTCTTVTIRVIDDNTNKTLGEYTLSNPPAMVSKSFTGLDSNLRVRVTVNATFQSGATFDFKDLEAYATTK